MRIGRYRHTGRGTTFVDEEQERLRAGLAIAAIVAFLVSGWYSFRELKYALRGKSADAQVTRTYKFTVPTRHGQSRPRLGVEYTYLDQAGNTLEAKDWVPFPSPLQDAGTLPVQYLPDGDSRLLANRSWLGPLIFAGCVGFVMFTLARWIRDANTPIRRGRRRPGERGT